MERDALNGGRPKKCEKRGGERRAEGKESRHAKHTTGGGKKGGGGNSE